MRDLALSHTGQFNFRQSASKPFLPPGSSCLGMISGGVFQPGGLLQVRKSDHRDDTRRLRHQRECLPIRGQKKPSRCFSKDRTKVFWAHLSRHPIAYSIITILQTKGYIVRHALCMQFSKYETIRLSGPCTPTATHVVEDVDERLR